jgi:hypothetical protein
MKRMIAAVIVSVALAAGISASAQNHPNARLVRVDGQGSAFPMSCNVNGVTYGVDFANNIWGVNLTTGQLVIIGHLFAKPGGFVAVDLARNQYSAACW